MSEAATIARPGGVAPGVQVLLRVLAVPVGGFFAFGLALAIGVPSDRIALLGISITTGTLILTVVALDRARPRENRSLLLSIFSFSYFCFFVIPVFVFYLGGAGYDAEGAPNPIPLTPRDVTKGALAALIGYGTLLAGFALPLGSFAASALPRMKREWSIETCLAVALFALSLGWAITLAGQFGLIPARAGSGVIGSISKGASFGIALIALCHQRYRSKAALVMLLLVIPPTMFFNFFTSSKMLFLIPLVMIAIVHILVTRRLRAWWIAGFLVVMSLFYPVSKAYREYLFGNELRAVQVIASPQRAVNLLSRFVSSFELDQYMLSGIQTTANRLDGLAMLSVIMRDAGNRVPFQGGWTIAYIPMAYVPRVIWPEKPRFEIGYWVTANFGFGPHILSSTGCTWMGELYFNFGWMGIWIGMTILGVWFRFIQESFLALDATIPAMLAGVVAVLSIATGVGGDLLGPINTVIFAVAPIILTHIAVRTIMPPPATLPPPL